MKLYILGNGFDISHGIPCKYLDFYNYLKKNEKVVLKVMEKYYYLGEKSDLWKDFERGLEELINYDYFAEIISYNTPDIGSDDFRDRDWYDAQINMEHECDDLLENIQSSFERWINSLSISKVKEIYKLEEFAYFITFNYTKILEETYRIPLSNILHIHNKVGEKLIFGHGKKKEDFNVKKALYGDENAFLEIDEYGNIESNYIGHEEFAENEVCELYEKMRKPIEKTIPKLQKFINIIPGISEIIVLGHSYNEIDLPYFREIKNLIKDNTKWTLYYYSCEDKKNAKKLVEKVNIDKRLITYKCSNKCLIGVIKFIIERKKLELWRYF